MNADDRSERFDRIWRDAEPLTRLSVREARAIHDAALHVMEAAVPGGLVAVTDDDPGAALIMFRTVIDATPGATRRLTVFGASDPKAMRATLREAGCPRRLTRIERDPAEIPSVETNEIALVHCAARSDEALPALYNRISKGGIIVDADPASSRAAWIAALGGDEAPGATRPYFVELGDGLSVAQKIDPAARKTIDRYDYRPPGLIDPGLAASFPNMTEADPEDRPWRYLRYRVPHKWRVDARDPARSRIGMLSMEEAILLHNLARPFAGKPGLEIGAHHGWSSVHILAAGVDLDIVDPVFGNETHRSEVAAALEKAAPGPRRSLLAGYSPSIIPAIAPPSDRRWAFIFIDGNHDGDAPATDAAAVAELAADDALVVFHDLNSPDVANGLRVLKDAGWSTRVFNTMQIMGAAWRGDVAFPEHVADPNNLIPPPPHLTDMIDAPTKRVGVRARQAS